MWDWRESHPASPLYYSWGGMVKNCNEKSNGINPQNIDLIWFQQAYIPVYKLHTQIVH